jgi:cysteine desulfurase family protein (TIGR01976 family)
MLDITAIRRQFPALQRVGSGGGGPVYLDGPGGTQVPQCVVDAMVRYLTTCNANHGGVFTTSRESDYILAEAHQAVADLVNAYGPEEIVFGQNMTSLTFHLSRSLAQTWKPGDEVMVTQLDHDANIRPWVLAARDAGATVRWVDIHPEDCTLDEESFRSQLSDRTRLVALTCASNLVGTIPDVKRLTAWAKEAGALVFLDAVHFAPHRLIDVQDWGCDFLACSAYKFFGPHVGILSGRSQLLKALTPYKVKPASESIPDRWMTGTQNHEGLAGVLAAVNYLTSLASGQDRRSCLERAMQYIEIQENSLLLRLLQGLASRSRFQVKGIPFGQPFHGRTPTVAVTCADRTPRQLAEHLARHEIYAWDGNCYAVELTERLGLEVRGGVLRLGLVHYNTADEVDRTLRVLDEA